MKNFIEKKAQEIIDRFFSLGAKISRADYDFVVSILTQQRTELREKIVGMKNYRFSGCITHRGNTNDGTCDVCLISIERNSSYNQALSDIIDLLDKEK